MESNAREISVKIRKGAEVIAKNLQKYILKLTALQIYYIKQRVDKGVDVDGNGFKRYNTDYARRKLAYRGNLDWLKLAPTPVLMNSFISELLNARSARIIVSNSKAGANFTTRDLAAWHNNGMGNNPKREFFAISNSEVDKLNDALLKMIREDLKNALQ